jgi:hypothetical protein
MSKRKKSKTFDPKVLAQLKSWDWPLIVHFGLNEVSKIKSKGNLANFLRGDFMEDIVSEQDDQLELVGQDHKDFEWHRFNLSLECKSLLSKNMYDRRGALKSNYTIKLCSLRSNNKIKPSQICDIILVIMKDGAFIIPKNIAVHNTIQTGKQVDIVVASNHIIQVSGPINLSKYNNTVNIDQEFYNWKKSLIKKVRSKFKKIYK